jgi:hypothetical protein
METWHRTMLTLCIVHYGDQNMHIEEHNTEIPQTLDLCLVQIWQALPPLKLNNTRSLAAWLASLQYKWQGEVMFIGSVGEHLSIYE